MLWDIFVIKGGKLALANLPLDGSSDQTDDGVIEILRRIVCSHCRNNL